MPCFPSLRRPTFLLVSLACLTRTLPALADKLPSPAICYLKYGRVLLRSTTGQITELNPKSPAATCLSISPDGKTAAFDFASDQISLRSLNSNSSQIIRGKLDGEPVWQPNGSDVWSTSEDGQICKFNLRTRQFNQIVIKPRARYYEFSIHPRSKFAAVTRVPSSGEIRTELRLVKLSDSNLQTFNPPGQWSHPSWSPDGKSLAALKKITEDFGTLVIFDAKTLNAKPHPELGKISEFAWSPDSSHIAAIVSHPRSRHDPIKFEAILIWNVNQTRAQPVAIGCFEHLVWNSTGTKLLLTCWPFSHASNVCEMDPGSGRMHILEKDASDAFYVTAHPVWKQLPGPPAMPKK